MFANALTASTGEEATAQTCTVANLNIMTTFPRNAQTVFKDALNVVMESLATNAMTTQHGLCLRTCANATRISNGTLQPKRVTKLRRQNPGNTDRLSTNPASH